MPKIVSLAVHCRQIHREDLLAEYAADNPLSAEEIGYTSRKNVTWRCAYGHTATESPYNRLRRGYCKTCGKRQEGSFAQNYPEVARLWSKKNPVLPTEISPAYSKPVLWECDKGHIWKRSIAAQIHAAAPCPFCKNEANALFTLHPELLTEWDTKRNGNIAPSSVRFMSNVQYHWICPRGHSFTASPAERIRRHKGCPICSSFGMQYPDAAAEWHPSKNTFTPYEVSPSSTKTAWFICQNCGTEYQSVIQDRARRKRPYCPYCPRKK